MTAIPDEPQSVRISANVANVEAGTEKMFVFQPAEISLIWFSLIEWRNEEIQAKKAVVVEVIS